MRSTLQVRLVNRGLSAGDAAEEERTSVPATIAQAARSVLLAQVPRDKVGRARSS